MKKERRMKMSDFEEKRHDEAAEEEASIVTLLDENGEQLRIRQEDQMLYDRNINEGDLVVLDQKRCLRKTG